MALGCAVAAATLVAIAARAPAAATIAVAAGLGYLAAFDWTERRVPAAALRATTVAAVVLSAGTSVEHSDWEPLGRGLAVGIPVFALLAVTWWVAPGLIGFGDVKTIALAAGAAAAESWRVLSTVAAATSLAGVALVALSTLPRLRELRDGRRTVPFVPALCVGYVVGVVA